jgi:multiple sugar transport system substrate-binding protein
MLAELDSDLPIPLYFQLKTLLLEEIAHGRYGPGDRLPTEHELCKQFGISRTPVHRALTELAQEGVVLRKRRSGTFVNPHWAPRARERIEIRVIVSDARWEQHIRASAPDDVSVNVAEVSYADLRQTLTRAVAEGLAPDMAILDSVWISEFAEAGFLLPLDELDPTWIEVDFSHDFLSPFVEGYRYGGHVYAVPEETNVAGLWCRRDLLNRNGFEPPTTWDEFMTVADLVASDLPSGAFPVVMPGGSRAGETTTYCFLAILASNGVKVIDDGVRLDSAATVGALRLLRSLVDNGLMSTEVVAYGWTQAPRLLAAGRAALGVGGSYEAGVLATATGMGLPDIWDHFSFVPFPAGPHGKPATVMGAMAYGIFRQSADPYLTMRVLKHFASTESLARRSLGEPTIPPRLSTIRMVTPHSPFVATTAKLFETAVTRPITPVYHLVSAQIQLMVEAVITGRLRPAAAAERTAEIIGAITDLPVRHGS